MKQKENPREREQDSGETLFNETSVSMKGTSSGDPKLITVWNVSESRVYLANEIHHFCYWIPHVNQNLSVKTKFSK